MNILTTAVSYFLGHLQIRFLHKKTLLHFLNLPKMCVLSYLSFLYSDTECINLPSRLYAFDIPQRNPVQNGSQKKILQYFLWLDSELEKMCCNFTQKK